MLPYSRCCHYLLLTISRDAFLSFLQFLFVASLTPKVGFDQSEILFSLFLHHLFNIFFNVFITFLQHFTPFSTFLQRFYNFLRRFHKIFITFFQSVP